jgi:hypothetical protein
MKPMKKRHNRALLLAAALLGTMLGASSAAQQQSLAARKELPPLSVQELSWLSGSWVLEKGPRRIEEHWTEAAENAIIGMSRTVVGGRVVAFEYLRVEGREEGIYYVAMPNGKTATSFKLVKQDGQSATIENLQHDFPKRILYRKNADGSLTARIEGDGREKEKPQEFHFVRIR